jgi:hypothetical protein
MDSLAVSYSGELARWGVETSIVVPGAFTSGTNHFADAGSVATEIARIVALPAGKRPYRVHVDPSRDGSEEVSAIADRVRRELLRRVDLDDLLRVSAS